MSQDQRQSSKISEWAKKAYPLFYDTQRLPLHQDVMLWLLQAGLSREPVQKMGTYHSKPPFAGRLKGHLAQIEHHP